MLRKITLIVVCAAMLFSAVPARADTGPIQRLGTGIPTSIAASPDGKTLAVGSSIGVWFLDAATLTPNGFWDTGVWVNSVEYSTDGRYLRVNETVYDTASGTPAGVDAGQVGWTNHTCSFDRILCAEIDIDHLNIHNTDTLVVIALIRQWYPLDATWSLDNLRLYTVDRHIYAITVWNTQTWKESQRVSLASFAPSVPSRQDLSLSSTTASNQSAKFRFSSNRVYVYDQTSKDKPREFVPHHIVTTAAAFNSDQSLIVTSGGDRLACRPPKGYYRDCSVTASSTRIWDAQSMLQLTQLPVVFYDVRLTPDDKVVIGHTQTGIEAWDWQNSRRLWAAEENIGWRCELDYYAGYWWCYDETFGLAIDSSGKYVASYANASSTTAIYLRRISDGELVSALVGHTAPTDSESIFNLPPYFRWGVQSRMHVRITGVAFNPDGTKVAASSLDGTILIWDVP